MKIYLFLLITALTHTIHAQINWESPRINDPFILNSDTITFVLLTADWCQYCALQKKKLKKVQIDNYRFIELNAYKKQSIIWKSNVYNANSDIYSPHTIITALTHSENLILPTWVVLSTTQEVIRVYEGVLDSEFFLCLP